MQDKNVFSKALGIVLTLQGTKEQKEFINLLEADWFEGSFYKSVFNAMKAISDKNTVVDMLNICEWLRENDQFKSDSAYEVTKLTNDVGFTDTINRLGVINACWYNYSVRRCWLMVENVNKELLATAPRSNYVLEQVTQIKDLLTHKTTGEIVSNQESIKNVISRHNDAKNGIPLGLELGFDNLKGKVLLEPDDVMVIGGRPAMGKTAFAIALIKNLCFNQNKTVVLFSLEMAKDRIIRRILSNITGIDSNKIKYGHCNKSELHAIDSTQGLTGWDNLHVIDGSQSAKDIEIHLNAITAKQEVDVFVIDYLQKILPSKAENRYQEVTKISNDVKRIVMANRIPCIALAQLSRDIARSGKRPSLPDLKESGEIEQDASIVGFLHRPEYYGETMDENGNDLTGKGEFITAKNRDGEIGINLFKVDLPTSDWQSYEPTMEQFTSQNQFNDDYVF